MLYCQQTPHNCLSALLYFQCVYLNYSVQYFFTAQHSSTQRAALNSYYKVKLHNSIQYIYLPINANKTSDFNIIWNRMLVSLYYFTLCQPLMYALTHLFRAQTCVKRKEKRCQQTSQACSNKCLYLLRRFLSF